MMKWLKYKRIKPIKNESNRITIIDTFTIRLQGPSKLKSFYFLINKIVDVYEYLLAC